LQILVCPKLPLRAHLASFLSPETIEAGEDGVVLFFPNNLSELRNFLLKNGGEDEDEFLSEIWA
jgi:hypothetical protein